MKGTKLEIYYNLTNLSIRIELTNYIPNKL